MGMTAADAAAVRLIFALGGPAAVVEVRRALRWIDAGEAEKERQLTFILRALEKRLNSQTSSGTRFFTRPAEMCAEQNRFAPLDFGITKEAGG